MRGEPGTTCRLTYDTNQVILAGDFVRTAAGSCYRVDAVRQSPSRRDRWLLNVTRLGRDAVEADAEGVHVFYWHPRRRRPR